VPNVVADEVPLQWLRDTFIEQHQHALRSFRERVPKRRQPEHD
jgi:hypothetical protein